MTNPKPPELPEVIYAFRDDWKTDWRENLRDINERCTIAKYVRVDPAPTEREMTGEVEALRGYVSDADLDAAWGNSNFGSISKRDLLKDTLLKYATGYSTGSTASQICQELGLITGYPIAKEIKLTSKGQHYLYSACQTRYAAMSKGTDAFYVPKGSITLEDVETAAPDHGLKSDLSVCPRCYGPADNGHDRCVPPTPYLCKACSAPPSVGKALEIGQIVLRELDTGGGDYLTVRKKIAELSGIPPMAITLDEHLDKIRQALRTERDGWRDINDEAKNGDYVLVWQEGVLEPSVTVCSFDEQWNDKDGWWLCCDGKNPEIPLRGPAPKKWKPINPPEAATKIEVSDK